MQKKQAEKELQSAEEVVPRAARECYKWLLCPVQNTPTDPKPTVEAFPLTTTGGSTGSETRTCLHRQRTGDYHLVSDSPANQAQELYWKDGKTAAGAMAFWEDTLRYLYLPRLKNRDSLSQAIRTGAASRDFFGTAYGQSGDTFEGFQLGEGNVQFDDTLLLIEPVAAKDYEASIKKPDADRSTGPGQAADMRPPAERPARLTTGQTGTGPDFGTTGPDTAAAKPKSFHGSIQINPSTAKMRLVQVAEEIISLLASDPNASLNITVEINAEFPTGASDQIKRAVTENATSLGFKTKDWE